MGTTNLNTLNLSDDLIVEGDLTVTGTVDGAISSGAATDGYVLTADGSGGSAWEAVAGGGGTTVQVLSTTTGINMKTESATVLYTVPVGKSLVVTEIFLVATDVDTVIDNGTVQVGVSPNYNEWLNSATFYNTVTNNGGFQSFNSQDSSNNPNIFSAGDEVSINITTAATATTAVFTCHLLGFLLDA